MKKITILFFLLILFSYSCDNEMYKEKLVAHVKRVHDTVIAEVNGIPITLSDYKREAENLPEELRNLLKNKKKQTQFVENLVTRELLFQDAKKSNMDKRKNVSEMLREYRKNLMINELINVKVRSKVVITDEEAYKFYMQNKSDFYTSDEIFYTEYFFKDYTDAENFLKNFDLSQCFNKCFSKSEGPVFSNDIPPDIASVIANLKVGEYGSDILFHKDGYLVVELKEKKKGHLIPFYKVKKEIKLKLKQAKEKKVLNEFITELKNRAKVRILWDNLKVLKGK